MDPLEFITYAALFGIGFILGRFSLAMQFALGKKKKR